VAGDWRKAGPVPGLVRTEEAKMMQSDLAQDTADFLKKPVDSQGVNDLFRLILGRPAGDEEFLRAMHHFGDGHYWIDRLLGSEEFRINFAHRAGFVVEQKAMALEAYRVPSVLGAGRARARRVVLTGSCLLEFWKDVIEEKTEAQAEFVLFNNASDLPDLSAAEAAEFDFQIGQIPLRHVIYDSDIFAAAFSYADEEAAQRLFGECKARLERNVEALAAYHAQHGLDLVILNFAVPQLPVMGRLLGRYHYGNIQYFIGELNRHLEDYVRDRQGIFIADFDGVLQSLGKRHFMDDAVTHTNHGGPLGDAFAAQELNLTAFGDVHGLYASKLREAAVASFAECEAIYAIARSDRKIKLVVFDLDGTLWRGVAADEDDFGPAMSEGWPIGMLEAVCVLRARGILVAIASKNDIENVQKAWQEIYGHLMPLDHFVSVKANWGDKSSNIAEILLETNILPQNVLFVDDNPIERERVAAAFPEMAIISGDICTWRRQLLWSPELEVPFLTEESRNRTQSLQAVAERERLLQAAAQGGGHGAEALDVKAEFGTIGASDDRKFNRAMELLNKTNQFNTTGRRWTPAEMEGFFAQGGQIIFGQVSDRLSKYGLTVLALVQTEAQTGAQGGVIHQIVMSCRIFGLQVEYALLEYLLRQGKAAGLLYTKTAKNGPVRGLLGKIGILPADGDGEGVVALSLDGADRQEIAARAAAVTQV